VRRSCVVQQAYRFELDPNEAQRVLLAKSVGASRRSIFASLRTRSYRRVSGKSRLSERKALARRHDVD
jgi:Helix-turn-helix domain